jgi:outer membrane protein TolC
MLTAESTLLEARRQMAALVAEAANQRVALLLSVGGGFATEKAGTETNSKQGAMP